MSLGVMLAVLCAAFLNAAWNTSVKAVPDKFLAVCLICFGAAVVSLPCWAAFDRLPRTQRDEILKPGSLRVAIEAAVGFGWEKYLGESGIFVGMHGFGTSAPAPDAYAHFGITAEKVVEQVLERLAHA